MEISIRKAANGFTIDAYRRTPVSNTTDAVGQSYEPSTYVFTDLESALAKVAELLK